MTAPRPRRAAAAVACCLCAALLAGCGSTSSGEGGGSTLRNLLLYGGTTVPPAAREVDIEAECPPVAIIEGGAALRRFAGGPSGEALRDQLSIANVARECSGRPDGSVVVKVGVEGRVLLGPAGGAGGGQFSERLNVVVKRGDRVLASRVRPVSVRIPPGETQGGFVVVEEGLVVPPGTGEFDIEVGLGAAGVTRASERPARRRAQR